MVRNYKKSSRCKWSDSQMNEAVQSVLSGKSCKRTAEEFNIPRSTLQKKIKLMNKNQVQEDTQIKAGFARVFSYDQEQVLVRYILEMESKMMGLDSNGVRSIAYAFAEQLGVAHKFNKNIKKAGKDWLRSFMSRHELSHRKSEHTSSTKIIGKINKEAVNDLFVLLKKVHDEHSFPSDKVNNVDGTRIHVPTNIIAKKGRRQVGGLTAEKKGESVTAENQLHKPETNSNCDIKDKDDMVHIPLSVIIQAESLIHCLYSSLPQDLKILDPKNKQKQSSPSACTKNIADMPSIKTSNKKGKSAIITNDEYKENLQQLKSITKENCTVKKTKEPIKSFVKTVETGHSEKKNVKQIVKLNESTKIRIQLSNNTGGVTNDNYLNEMIPDSCILTNQTTFINDELVQICYIDEAKNLNII